MAYVRPRGLQTVSECQEHADVGPWLERVLAEEIVPVIADRAPEAEAFARATLDRFRNPFLNHSLSSIALNHETKVNTRLTPTLADYRALWQVGPAALCSTGLRIKMHAVICAWYLGQKPTNSRGQYLQPSFIFSYP